jgi:hypothetical protein
VNADEEETDFVKMDGNVSHQIEYYVDVDDDNYYGNGMYKENKIIRKA